MGETLLQARGIKKYFQTRLHLFSGRELTVRAVDGIDLTIQSGETLGLVGESGCGKTTLGRVLAGLEACTEGSLQYQGREIKLGKGPSLKDYHQEVQMIFQDPYASLNPRMSAGTIIGEPMVIHRADPKGEIRDRVREVATTVGLREEQLDRYPHEFSGGQRQRIGIARALMMQPRLIIADEPVSALDVSIQAQILNLLKGLQQTYALTYLFITHDLSVLYHMSDRIAVMYLGKLVEAGPREEICARPSHPYTEALLAAVPDMELPGKRHRKPLQGEAPSPTNPPPGCAFHPRCPQRMTLCERQAPQWREMNDGHGIACHRQGD